MTNSAPMAAPTPIPALAPVDRPLPLELPDDALLVLAPGEETEEDVGQVTSA